MSSKKVVVVIGATGLQGGAVARALTRTGRFMVRGVTRDLTSRRAQDLRAEGVDLMSCDLNDKQGLSLIMHGAYGCFINTATNFSDPNCLDTEIAQGCYLADICKKEGIQHVIFSSQLNSLSICSIMARHLVAKAEIEKYMRDLGLPLTCLIMPVYFQDMLDLFKPVTQDGRNYDVEIPMGQTPLDMMSVDDVGDIVVCVMCHRDHYLDKTVSVCGDKITVREMAHVFSKYLGPKVFKDKQLTVFEWNSLQSSRLEGATDWANMFQFFMRVDQRYNLAESKRMNPNIRSFEQWVAQTADFINSVI